MRWNLEDWDRIKKPNTEKFEEVGSWAAEGCHHILFQSKDTDMLCIERSWSGNRIMPAGCIWFVFKGGNKG